MADLHAASEATRPGFSLEAEMAVSKVTELELEIEALKMKLVETEKKGERNNCRFNPITLTRYRTGLFNVKWRRTGVLLAKVLSKSIGVMTTS